MDDNANEAAAAEDHVMVDEEAAGPSKPWSKVRLPPGAGAVFKEYEVVEGLHDAITGKPKDGSRCKHCKNCCSTIQLWKSFMRAEFKQILRLRA